MSEHLDLFGLLRGELSNAETIATGEHLAGCPTCLEELAEEVVGHALLTRASRTLGPVDQTPRPVPLQVSSSTTSTARRRSTLLAVAAAVVVGLGVAGAVWWQSDPSRPDNEAGIEAALAPLSASEVGDGNVRMVEHDGRTRMTLAVHGLPRAAAGEFYYAWLLDPSTNKMLALGVVDSDTGATFDLDDTLVASYSAVDVSLETDDGDPAHSITSVLRGDYEPDQITTTEGKPS